MHLDPSRRSHDLKADGLLDFLRYQARRHEGMLNLLLDEVDEVCTSKAFEYLGEAAKLGHCRLVLSGKAKLLDLMLFPASPLQHRLKLLKLSPLEEDSARALLLEPLQSLGFTLIEEAKLVNQIFHLTGCLPNLMQYFAEKLVSLALEEGRLEIHPAQVEALEWDFETAQFFLGPLLELRTVELRLLAFALLGEKTHEFNLDYARHLASRLGLTLDERETLLICNELIINNLLAWSKGSYHIANRALVDYARRTGILETGFREAQRAVLSSTRKTTQTPSKR